MGLDVRAVEKNTAAKHIFTHAEWHMVGYTADISGDGSDEAAGFLWRTADEIRESYAIPTALKKYAALME